MPEERAIAAAPMGLLPLIVAGSAETVLAIPNVEPARLRLAFAEPHRLRHLYDGRAPGHQRALVRGLSALPVLSAQARGTVAWWHAQIRSKLT